MRSFKLIFIVLFCYLITSCSFIKTSYNNAPKLGIWWLNDYFNLTPTQTHTLEPALNNLHFWHRKQQLPEITALLNTMQTAFASDNVIADAVCEQVQSFKSSVHALQTESIPIILAIAPTLTDQQMAKFQKKLDKRAQKWKSEWWQESEKEQLSMRLDKAEDFAEKVYGDLSDEQLKLINQRLTQANFNPAITYGEITRRNNDAFGILNKLRLAKINNNESIKTIAEQSIDQITGPAAKLVQAGFDRIQTSPDIAYQTYANNMARNSCETISILHATTSAEQRLHAKKWFGDNIKQLTELQIK